MGKLFGKFLDVATIGSTMTGIVLLKRLVSGVAMLVILATVSACMCCVLLLGAFYGLYYGLVSYYGLQTYIAFLSVGALALIVTLGFLLVTIRHVRRIKGPAEHTGLPGFTHIHSIADAFIDGLLAPRKFTRD